MVLTALAFLGVLSSMPAMGQPAQPARGGTGPIEHPPVGNLDEITLDIDGITPANPVENQAVDVAYTLRYVMHQFDRSDKVGQISAPPLVSPTAPITVPVGSPGVSGTLRFTAPPAGTYTLEFRFDYRDWTQAATKRNPKQRVRVLAPLMRSRAAAVAPVAGFIFFTRTAETPPVTLHVFPSPSEQDVFKQDLASKVFNLANPAPYDVVWAAVDDNGFPLNPLWGKQYNYMRSSGSQNLWDPKARPDIYADCLDHADKQTANAALDVLGEIFGVGPVGEFLGNDYNPFKNAYAKNSPPLYGAAWSWKDEPFTFKCLTSPFLGLYRTEGHMNFSIATYDGIARWDNAQAEYCFDDDWCVDLYTPHGAGVSGLKKDDPFIHTEFSPEEIGDGFDRGFWGTFRDVIHNAQVPRGAPGSDLTYSDTTSQNEWISVGPLINGKRAIVIGLLGLDMGHDDAGAELHPVYGMAIHTGGRPLAGTGFTESVNPVYGNWDNDAYNKAQADPLFDTPQKLEDDTWAIWAANFGSEGYCSSGALHVLDGDQSIIGRTDVPTLSFRLPWAKDAAGVPMNDVQVLDTTNFAMHAAKTIGRTDTIYDVWVNPGTSIVVTFHMWPSDARPYWFGELHLKWQRAPRSITGTLPAATHGVRPSFVATTPAAHRSSDQEEAMAMAKLSPKDRTKLFAHTSKAPKKPAHVVGVSIVGTRRTMPAPPIQPLAVTRGP